MFPGAAVLLLSIAIAMIALSSPCLGCQQESANAGTERVAPDKSREEEAGAWIDRGMEATELNEKEHCYLEALKIQPSHPLAHNNLGDVYETQGRFQEALREYNLAVTTLPTFAPAHFGIGDVNLKLGRFHYAVRAYEIGLLLKPEDELSIRRIRIAKVLMQAIYFDFDSSELTIQVQKQLRKMGSALQEQEVRHKVFEVQGNADSIGAAEYNLQLSLRRAQTVKDFLVSACGIAAERLIVIGYGEDKPTASNKTSEGRSVNRRVVLSFCEM